MGELKTCPFCNGRAFIGIENRKYWVECSECGAETDGFRTAEEAAEAWNARVGNGECEFVIEDDMNETEGMGDVWIRCTSCDTCFDYYENDWLLMHKNYCPHCGARAREAVE